MDALRVIEELSVPGRLPVAAIRAAQADRDAMVPLFLEMFDDLLELRGPVDPNALFFMFHLLGEWREKSAYWSLAVFLQLPGDVLEEILGDCVTQTSHRVMAAVFDGDPDPLYQIIRDPGADEFVRAKMCQTIAMLTRRGELPREATAAFLRDCHTQLEPRNDCYVWSGWTDAVVWLGLAELKPLVQQAFQRGSIDPTWFSFADFERDLQYTVDHPDAEPLHPDGDLNLFGDTVAEMTGWACFQPKARGDDMPDWSPRASLGMPHRATLRKVGRNDPCPCGSGRKFKKCCLNATVESPSANEAAWQPAPLIRRR